MKQLIQIGIEGRVFANDGIYYLSLRRDDELGGESLYAVLL